MAYKSVYLALGSNLGDRKDYILRSIEEMKKAGINIEKCSTLIETEPIGEPAQGKFINAVIRGETDLSPQNLLDTLKKIEKDLGRVKTQTNGPRVIDIDILLYENIKMDSEQLKIPHPRMLHRDFVMMPLKEIDAEKFEELVHANC